MKRFIIAMALVVFMTGAVSAEGMMFGVKGGLNMANLYGDDVEDSKMKMAFGGGVWMNYGFNEALSLQPELMFMMKGAEEDVDDGGKIKLTYLDINLLLKYAIPMEGNFVPFFNVGPQFAMLMSANYEDSEEDVDIKDYMKSMDIGAVFGIGFDYMLEAGGCITVDARYVLGLTSVDDPEEGDASDTKNSGIQFMVGYGFNF